MATTYDLICHPDTPTRAVSAVRATVERESGNRLVVSWTLQGNRGVLLPRWSMTPERRDELWKDTCFELFARRGEGPAYLEFNVTTLRHWAAYAFDTYRDGMRDLHPARITFQPHNGTGDLAVLIDLTGVGELAGEGLLKLGISAVLKDERGKVSYWALAHPPGKPDFHHAACFAAVLGAAPRP